MPNVEKRLFTSVEEIAPSAISLGEIMFGHERTSATNQDRRDECERWINNQFPRALSVSRSTRTHYGSLKAGLFAMFPPVAKNENHPERCFDRVTGVELGID